MRKINLLICLVIAISVTQKAKANGNKLSNYTLPEHCDTFFGKKDKLYLHGPWKFKTVPGKPGYSFTDEGAKEKYWLENYDDSKWETVTLPRKINIKKNRVHLITIQSEGIGYYRQSFLIPEKKKGKRAILTFRKVAWEPVIWVNGKEVARPFNFQPGKISDNHEIDITEEVKWGQENLICVRFYIRKGRGYDKENTNGIFEPFWIEFVPSIYCDKMLITPELPDKINVKCEIINTEKEAKTVKIKAIITPWKGNSDYQARLKGTSETTTLELPAKTLKPGKNELIFTAKVKKTVLWDLDNPFLYSLKLLDNDKVIGWERFGLRKFETKNQYFYLNGKKVFLFGISPEGTILVGLQRHDPGFHFNKNNFLRKYLEKLKESNINTIFRIEKIPPQIFLDICDEIGMLNIPTPDILNFETYAPEHTTRMIKANRAKYLKEALTRNLEDAFNHPSVVAFTPEGECNRVPGVSTDFHRYKKILDSIDSSRLFSSAQSGVIAGKDINGQLVPLIPPPPFDFVNSAALQGSCGLALPHTMLPDYIKRFAKIYNSQFFLGQQKPTIFTEALYYYGYRSHNQYWPKIQSIYGKVITDGKLDKNLYCELYGKSVADNLTYCDFHYQDTKIAGIKNSLNKKTLYPKLATYIGEMIEFVRMNDDSIQGFGSVSSPMMLIDQRVKDKLDPAGISTSPIGEAFKEKCAPVFICADMICGHNVFAGREYKVKVFCFNYSRNTDLKECKYIISIKDKKGNIVNTTERKINDLSIGTKQEISAAYQIPNSLQTGNYTMTFILKSSGRTVSENQYPLFVMSKTDENTTITTDKKVGIIDAGDHYFYTFNPTRLMGKLGVKAELIKDTSKLAGYDVVIIAQESIPTLNKQHVYDHTQKINVDHMKTYLANGGKVVCLSQRGQIPFVEGLTIAGTGTIKSMRRAFRKGAEIGTSADLIEPEHPLLAGINKWENWRNWNAEHGRIFSFMGFPLNNGVILAGGTNGRNEKLKSARKLTRFGMVAAEIKIGKGLLFLSQVEAMHLYGFDSVATKYIQNLFKYTLSDKWDGKYAAPLREEEN
jgi:glycosyl hydrolase family 2